MNTNTTNKSKYVECRKMSVEGFINLCERYGWYNCGVNDDYKDNYKAAYNKVVNFGEITIDDIVELSEDIVNHAHFDYNDFDFVSTELLGICWSYLKEI